jgi:hypothetical protein
LVPSFYCLLSKFFSRPFLFFFLAFYCLFSFCRIGFCFYRLLFSLFFFDIVLFMFLWLMWFHLYPTPTCLGLKGLVVVVVVTIIVSSLFPPRCCLSSSRHRHAVAPCLSSFSWNQDELTVSTSLSDNTSSCRLCYRAKIEVLNSYHRRQPRSPHRPTLTLHYYKKVISTLVTLSTTQPYFYFGSSLVRATRHQSSTHRHRFLSPSSHAHRLSTQRHP